MKYEDAFKNLSDPSSMVFMLADGPVNIDNPVNAATPISQSSFTGRGRRLRSLDY